jgi:hypothetical protein
MQLIHYINQYKKQNVLSLKEYQLLKEFYQLAKENPHISIIVLEKESQLLLKITINN